MSAPPAAPGDNSGRERVVDAHVHFYDPRRPQGIPHPSRSDPLYEQMLPARLKQTAGATKLDAVIAVECSPWLEDNQWLLNLVHSDPLVLGVVGNLDLTSAGCRAQLDRFAADPKFCGIRLRGLNRGVVKNPLARANLAHLAALGLTLDILKCDLTVPDIEELAAAEPGLRIMLDHLGSITIHDRSDDGDANTLRPLGRHDNVWCKLSGLMELFAPQPAPHEFLNYRKVLTRISTIFGPKRLVYGSNWPRCELFGGYDAERQIVETFCREVAPDDHGRIMGQNAATFYQRRI
jgi:L-fuconolactonase